MIKAHWRSVTIEGRLLAPSSADRWRPPSWFDRAKVVEANGTKAIRSNASLKGRASTSCCATPPAQPMKTFSCELRATAPVRPLLERSTTGARPRRCCRIRAARPTAVPYRSAPTRRWLPRDRATVRTWIFRTQKGCRFATAGGYFRWT